MGLIIEKSSKIQQINIAFETIYNEVWRGENPLTIVGG